MKKDTSRKRTVILTILISLFAYSANAGVDISLDNEKTIHQVDSLLKTVSSISEQADLLLTKGLALKALQRPMQSKLIFEEIAVLDLPRFDKRKAKAYYHIAQIHFILKDTGTALEYNSKATSIYRAGNNKAELANAKIQKAGFIRNEGIYFEALNLYEEALQYYQKEKNGVLHAKTLYQIGLLEYQFENHVKAEKLFKEAAEYFKNKQLFNDEFETTNTLLDFYQSIEKYDDAMELALLSSSEYLSNNKYEEGAKLKERLAFFTKKKQDYRAAIKYQKEVIALKNEHALSGIVSSLLTLGRMHEEALQDTEAELIYSDALDLANQMEKPILQQDVALRLSQFYENRNNSIKAFYFLKLNDSLKTNRLTYLESELDKESNRQYLAEAEMIRNQSAKKQNFENEKSELQRNTIFTGIVVVILFLVALIIVFLQKKNQSKLFEWKVYKRTRQLRKVNGELNTFIYKSSHDLRTPLTNIKSLLRLLNKEEHNAATNKYLHLISNSTEQMDNILINLSEAVDYKKVDVKINKIDFQQIQYDIENKDISSGEPVLLNWNIIEKAPFFSDEKFIKVILRKTIANAKNYRSGSDEDYCNISITTDRNGANVSIEDNGVGIAEKVKENVFEMFVKGSNKSKGAGLGLYLVKIASDKIKGKISLESTEKKGSKLLFHLPNLN